MILQTPMIMFHVNLRGCTLRQTNIAMENGPFEVGISHCYVSLPEGRLCTLTRLLC